MKCLPPTNISGYQCTPFYARGTSWVTFLYTNTGHFALRDFHGIFEIVGGGGAFLYPKNNALCVTFLYTENNALCEDTGLYEYLTTTFSTDA